MPSKKDVALARLKEIIEKYGNLKPDEYDKLKEPNKPGRPFLRNMFGPWQVCIARAIDYNPVTPGHVSPEFLDKKQGELDWREVIDIAVKQQQVMKRNSWSQDSCKITIPTSDPIAVVYSSDEHLGAIATDYESWRRDIDFLIETPGLYMVSGGDFHENQRSFRSVSPVITQIIPPDLQVDVLSKIIIELVSNDKLLAAGAGNHDTEFDERIFGKSNAEKIFSKLVPFFNGKGLLELTVGNRRYTNLIIHKTRFNSFLNDLHGAKREYQLTFPADCVVTAHTHKPAFEMYYHYDMAAERGYDIGPFSYLIKTGTYKVDCAYSKRYWTKGIIGTPTVVYYPDKRDMVIFRSAQQAVTFMNAEKGVRN